MLAPFTQDIVHTRLGPPEAVIFHWSQEVGFLLFGMCIVLILYHQKNPAEPVRWSACRVLWPLQLAAHWMSISLRAFLPKNRLELQRISYLKILHLKRTLRQNGYSVMDIYQALNPSHFPWQLKPTRKRKMTLALGSWAYPV
jgi:hypothetical protein